MTEHDWTMERIPQLEKGISYMYHNDQLNSTVLLSQQYNIADSAKRCYSVLVIMVAMVCVVTILQLLLEDCKYTCIKASTHATSYLPNLQLSPQLNTPFRLLVLLLLLEVFHGSLLGRG